MKVFKDRRRASAWKLRVYIDALKQAENTTDDEWVNNWIASGDANSRFVPRLIWIEVLKQWTLTEASQLVDKQAA